MQPLDPDSEIYREQIVPETQFQQDKQTHKDIKDISDPKDEECVIPNHAQVASGYLPPLKMTSKPPVPQNNKSLLQLREQVAIKRPMAQSLSKKMRDQKFLQNYIQNQRKKMTSLNLNKGDLQQKKPVFKSTKVGKPQKIKPIELRPQLKQMKDEYKLRQQSIQRFLSNSQILDSYKMLSHLGKGSFSVVGLAVNRQTNRRFAVKTYSKIDQMDDYKFDNIYRQINNLRQLDHQNIVNLFHVIKDKRKLLLIMEDAGKLSLAGLLRKSNTIPEIKVKDIFRQVVQGVRHCHQRRICHRDIKLQNILIDGGYQVRLIDFGFSSRCGERLKNFCGTPPYMAPQITAKQAYFGQPADMWAIGILLYLMLLGKFPFRATSQKELYRLIQQGKFQLNDSISSQAKEVIRKLLKCNIRQRATASQILNCKWLKQDKPLIVQ